MNRVDVVIPVYDGYEETVACLSSVLATVDRAWARPVVINDASPDQRITDYLRRLQREEPWVVLLENEQNLGFVATANRGMAYDEHNDVLLLNSDVEVAGDWLQRLREGACHHEKVASVTPFSNNATVCSFPNICEDNRPLFGLPLEEIDAQFSAEFTVEDAFQVPTGVGCCMYLRRECLDQIGFFDVEAFGRGYGEENDWCQRAARAGWRNLHLANCFVYHHGGVSFGSEYGPRLAEALDTLDRKYPQYHADIQRFIARDPARSARVRAWLRLFASRRKPKVLMISHKLGGGAQQHVDELARELAEDALFLLMIPDKDGQTVRLFCYEGERRLKDGLFFDIGTEYDKLLKILEGLGIGRVHFHHTMGLPTRLWGLADDLGCAYDLTVHDYYLVNGNPSLTDKQGRYVEIDAPDFDARCAEHRPLPEGVTGEIWRSNQEMLVEGAERVIFPSSDSAARFRHFFNVHHPVVARHADYASSAPYPEPVWRYTGNRPLRVLVMGAMSREKGADLLESVASALSGEAIEFHLLGYAYRRLSSPVIFHGPYNNDDVDDLVREIQPDVVWFPALWPETYSYTLSIALHNSLPVVVPDIGAFKERVRGRPLSVVVDWDWSTETWRDFWLEIAHSSVLGAGRELSAAEATPVRGDFYAGDYIEAVPLREGRLDASLLLGLEDNLYGDTLKLSRSEQLLKRIWHFSLRPAGARLIAMVPFRMQRSIKRYLSHRPMHDIVGK